MKFRRASFHISEKTPSLAYHPASSSFPKEGNQSAGQTDHFLIRMVRQLFRKLFPPSCS